MGRVLTINSKNRSSTTPLPEDRNALASIVSEPASASAIRTIALERAALDQLLDFLQSTSLGLNLTAVVELIVNSSGRVIVTGMGKSGLVGRKLSATLASTGTPSFFLHPADASHGDLGMIVQGDIVIALSWSGETSELSDVVQHCARFAIPLVAVSAHRGSTLATRASYELILPLVAEACPHALAPTSSTIVQAAIGDAIAVATIERRRFTPEDFRILHPSGQLGARLTRVADVMSSGQALPQVSADATVAQAMIEMSAKRFGVTAIVDEDDVLIGAFSDGDLRRSLSDGSLDLPVSRFMNPNPVAIPPTMLVGEALALMNNRAISQLFVCVADRLIGIVHVHDVLRIGVK